MAGRASRGDAAETVRAVLAAADRPGCRRPDGTPNAAAIARALGMSRITAWAALKRAAEQPDATDPGARWRLTDAQREFVAPHYPLALWARREYARRLDLDPWRAELAGDAATDALLRAAAKYPGGDTFARYARRCIRNAIYEALRREANRRAARPLPRPETR